jgi:transposase InsO family protein
MLLESSDEKGHRPQLAQRQAAPLVRHVLEQFRSQQLTAVQAAAALELSRRRLYQLHHDYLKAYAQRQHRTWRPGVSGGNHAAAWPAEVVALLHKRLGSTPPASYSFAASEAARLCGFRLSRAQVRRWALAQGVAHASLPPRAKAAVRRWQRTRLGELWQLDATPHRWFAGQSRLFPLLNLLDDCSRYHLGTTLYERELLLSYLDFLPTAFGAYGLPLELYVDYHSLFFSSVPDALTQLGASLHFYGVSFRYAPTPQAKGKIERDHQYWQSRLPAYFASEAISDLRVANEHILSLRQHRNRHEPHRELGMTAQAAWDLARREKRSVLRPVPRCPWWPYVWSQRTAVRVGEDGRVAVGAQRVRVEVVPGTRVVLCQHPSSHHTVLAAPPCAKDKPVVLFTNRPTPR